MTTTRTHVDFRARLRHFFANSRVELAIGLLILVSVVLILWELILPEASELRERLRALNYVFVVVFAVELALRFIAESEQPGFVKPFLRRWWLDLVAVYVPLVMFPLEALGGFVVLRSMRVLRLLRLLRLGRVFSSARYLFPYVVRRGAVHIGLVAVTLMLAVVVGTSVILALEREENPAMDSFAEAFWFSLYSMFAGEPVPDVPLSTDARIASVLLLFVGVLFFAAFVGTVSALMTERLQKGDSMRGLDDIRDHVIVCGLGRVGYRVLRVLQRLDVPVAAIERDEDNQFVEIARHERIPILVRDVRNAAALEDASIGTARAVIACTDDDLTNLEVALDARSLRSDIRVVLRLFDERLAGKVAEGFNIQVALSESALAAPAFAAAAVDRSVGGSLDVNGRVFIHSEFEVPVDSRLVGKTVGDLRSEYEVHVLGYEGADGVHHWSPSADHRIGDSVIIAIVGPFDRVAELKDECGVSQDLVRAAYSQ